MDLSVFLFLIVGVLAVCGVGAGILLFFLLKRNKEQNDLEREERKEGDRPIGYL